MAPFSLPTTLLLITIVLFFHIGLSSSASSASPFLVSQSQKTKLPSRKTLLNSAGKEDKPVSTSKLLKKKPILEAKNKNQTKLLKPKKKNNSTTSTTITTTTTTITKIKLPKLNKTLTAKSKPSNSTKIPKSIKPIKPIKSNSTKLTKTQLKKPLNSTSDATKSPKKVKPLLPNSDPSPPKPKQSTESKQSKQSKPSREEHPAWLDETDGEDLMSEFRGLPARLQEALVPDLERLSSTSRAYIYAANAGIAEGVRPYLGHKWAPRIALAASAAFLAAPLLLLGALLRHLGSCLPLVRRLLVFAQAYLAIYFATLAATALATGLEPLRLFYATSPGGYAWAQAAQSLGYVAYLVLQLVDLVAAFPQTPTPSASAAAAADGAGSRGASPAPALAQMVVGLAVGLHYYAAVFHRAVAGEPPRATWRVHAVYAACFLVICACARAERRKKEYVCVDGGEDGKKS